MATNSDRFIVAFYAASRVGAVVIPVNPASAPPELQYLLADSGAKVFVYDLALAATVDAAKSGFPVAMLIAWQTANKVASPRDVRFAKRFLVVTPSITIRDRLQVTGSQ